MSISRVFRKEVPLDLVEEIFQIVGLKSISDGSWFSRSAFTPEVLEKLKTFLPKLEEYYYPHKLFLIEREMNIVRYVQVMRQLAKSKGMVLESKEHKDKYQNRKKITLYRLVNHSLPSKVASFTVTFE